MKTLIITTAFLLSSLILSAQDIDRALYEKTKQDILSEISILERAYLVKLHRDDREMALRKLDNIVAMLNELEERSQPKGPEPMDHQEFNRLMKMVDDVIGSDEKKQIIFSSAQYNFFTIDQLAKLVDNVTFESAKIDVIERLYPKVLDKDKAYMLYEHLTFSDSKKRLEEIINSAERERKEHREHRRD